MPAVDPVDDKLQKYATPAAQGEKPVPLPQSGFEPENEPDAGHAGKSDAGTGSEVIRETGAGTDTGHAGRSDAGTGPEVVRETGTGTDAGHAGKSDAGTGSEVVRKPGAGTDAGSVRKPDTRQDAAPDRRVSPGSVQKEDTNPKPQRGFKRITAKMNEKPGTYAWVTGILSFFIVTIPWMCFFAMPLSIYGMALGIRGLKSGKKASPVIGLILNGIVLLIFLIVLL